MATVNNQIGLWNRSSVVKKERQEAIVVAMQRHKIPVCVLPETRTVGRCAYQWPSGFTLHNSASLNNRGGIGFLMSDQIQIDVFLPISERLAAISFTMIGKKWTLIGCYAPTLSARRDSNSPKRGYRIKALLRLSKTIEVTAKGSVRSSA